MEYRISKGWRIAAVIFSLLFIFGGLAFLLSPWYDANMHKAPVLAILVGAAFMALGCVAWADTIKSRLIIDGTSITQEGVFRRKSLLLNDIKGYRKEKGYVFLVPKSNGKALQVSNYVENLTELKAWIEEKYPDADQLVVDDETKGILADEHFGVTEDERKYQLAQATQVSKVFNIIAIILPLWLLFYPTPYQLAWLLVLTLPPISLYIVWRYKGLVTVNDTKKSAYPSMLAALLVSCLMVGVRALIDYDVYLYNKVWPYTIGIAVALTTATWVIAYTGYQKNINKKPILFVLALLFAGYGYGATVFYNCHFDAAMPTVFTQQVTKMYTTSGKSTTYYITTGPWGRFPDEQNISVPKSLYNSLQAGDSVNIFLKQGKLGIPWYFVGKKETDPLPAEITK
jgi:hypothetical protein